MRTGGTGMTLLEVMVAIGISVGMVGLMYVSARDVRRMKTMIEADAERLREAQMAMDRFGRDIRSAHLSGHRRPQLPKTDTAFVGEDDDPADRVSMITFSQVHRVFDGNDSDQAEVTYLAVEDPDDPEILHLARRISRIVDDHPLEGGAFEILVRDIREFDVLYYEAERDEWMEEWDTTQPTAQPNRLPPQVRVRLTLEDRHGGEITLATQIPLEVTQIVLIPGGFQ